MRVSVPSEGRGIGGVKEEGEGGRGKGLITDVIDAISDVTEPKLIKQALVCQFRRIIGD